MIYLFNKQQQKLIYDLGYDPHKDYNEEEADVLVNVVGDYLTDVGFDKEYNTNEMGDICESIITLITKSY